MGASTSAGARGGLGTRRGLVLNDEGGGEGGSCDSLEIGGTGGISVQCPIDVYSDGEEVSDKGTGPGMNPFLMSAAYGDDLA